MQLKLKRSQRSGGMMGGKVIFALDARADLSADEKALVAKYNLAKLSIYDSESRKRHAEAAAAHSEAFSSSGTGALGSVVNFGRASFSLAMAALSLKVSIDSLTSGQHIECKDMDELLGAEAAIVEACKYLKVYLETATTFDGREQVMEF